MLANRRSVFNVKYGLIKRFKHIVAIMYDSMQHGITAYVF